MHHWSKRSLRAACFFAVALSLSFTSAALSKSTTPKKSTSSAKIDKLIAQMTLDEKLEFLGGTGFGSKPLPRLKIASIDMIDGPQGIRGPRATAFPSSLSTLATWNPELMRKIAAGIGRDVRAYGKNMILGPCVSLYRVPQSGRNFECFGEDPYLNARFAEAYIKGAKDSKILTSTKHFLLNDQEIDRKNINMHADERSIRELELPAFEAAIAAGTESVMSSYNLVDGLHASENPALLNDLLRKQLGFDGVIVSDWESTYSSVGSAKAGLDLEMPFGSHMGKPLKPAVESGEVSMELIDGKVRRILTALDKIGALELKEKPNPPWVIMSQQNRAVALEGAREAIVLLKNDQSMLPLDPAKIRTLAVIGPNAATRRFHAGGSGEVSPERYISVLDGIKQRFPKAKILHERGTQADWQSELIEASSVESKTKDGKTVHGFQAEYFDNLDLKGKPVLVRTEPNIELWNTATPDPKLLKHDHYSARFTGTLLVEKGGRVTFDMGVTGRQYRLTIDGNVVKDLYYEYGGWEPTVTIENLTAGRHDIKLEYRNTFENFHFCLKWILPQPSMEDAIAAAKKADAVILSVGSWSMSEAEEADRPNIEFPLEQGKLIAEVLKANPRTTVVINSGGPLNLRPFRDQAPAILQAWFAGQESGLAIADVITGRVNPSGKLPITLPKALADSPSNAYYPNDGKNIDYSKVGVLDGYRGYDAKGIEPEFPFGHGLSYTTFAYSKPVVQVLNDSTEKPNITVSVDIKNTGKRAGAEVVQFYVGAQGPTEIVRPPKELKGFSKITLKPGETRTVRFVLGPEAFRFWDVQTHAWKVPAGTYNIHIGASSRDLRLTQSVALRNP